jgi:hypothetical protein
MDPLKGNADIHIEVVAVHALTCLINIIFEMWNIVMQSLQPFYSTTAFFLS